MTLLGLFITWYSHSIEKTDNVSGGLEMFQNSILFTAGQFARLHHLNKRTLHYYDDIGLFHLRTKAGTGTAIILISRAESWKAYWRSVN